MKEDECQEMAQRKPLSDRVHLLLSYYLAHRLRVLSLELTSM